EVINPLLPGQNDDDDVFWFFCLALPAAVVAAAAAAACSSTACSGSRRFSSFLSYIVCVYWWLPRLLSSNLTQQTNKRCPAFACWPWEKLHIIMINMEFRHLLTLW